MQGGSPLPLLAQQQHKWGGLLHVCTATCQARLPPLDPLQNVNRNLGKSPTVEFKCEFVSCLNMFLSHKKRHLDARGTAHVFVKLAFAGMGVGKATEGRDHLWRSFFLRVLQVRLPALLTRAQFCET